MAEYILSRAKGAPGVLSLDMMDSRLRRSGCGLVQTELRPRDLENLPIPCNGGWSQEWEEEEGLVGGSDISVSPRSGPTNV